jgi:hypothetical protein
MNLEERIRKDLHLFEKNMATVEHEGIRDMAQRYYRDAEYYLQRGEHVTAFGCIAYAHGLIDALRLL